MEDEAGKYYQIKSERDFEENECWRLIWKEAEFKQREMENEGPPGIT